MWQLKIGGAHSSTNQHSYQHSPVFMCQQELPHLFSLKGERRGEKKKKKKKAGLLNQAGLV